MQKKYNYGIDELSYVDQGKGAKTILFIHGFGEDASIWESQTSFLANYCRVIVPNLPGVHCTTLPLHHSQKPTLKLYVEILHALMHHLAIEEYFIVGHSMGGYIGLAFAEDYANHVKGLLLLHSTTYEDNQAKKESRMKIAEFIDTYGTSKYLETAVPQLFGTKFKKAVPEKIQTLIETAMHISKATMIQFVFAMRNRKSYTHLLQQKNMPIWMIVGKEDMAVPFEDSLAQIKLLNPKNVLVLNHVGHMGMLEESEEVNKTILQFIQSI